MNPLPQTMRPLIAIKLASRRFALPTVVGLLLLMATAGQANASPSIMRISSHVFPSGALLPGGMYGTALVAGGSRVTLTAPAFIYQQPVPPATSGTVYEFMFWDIERTLSATPRASVPVLGGAPFAATAWYLPTGGGSCTGSCPTALTTWAFSLTAYRVIPRTPIASVSPSSAWTAPSRSVSTATAVSVAAQPYLGAHSLYFGTRFTSWFVFGGGSTTTSGPNLNVPAGASPYGIAFYSTYQVPRPPPCIGYPHCI